MQYRKPPVSILCYCCYLLNKNLLLLNKIWKYCEKAWEFGIFRKNHTGIRTISHYFPRNYKFCSRFYSQVQEEFIWCSLLGSTVRAQHTWYVKRTHIASTLYTCDSWVCHNIALYTCTLYTATECLHLKVVVQFCFDRRRTDFIRNGS